MPAWSIRRSSSRTRYLTEEAREEAFEGVDIAFFATNDEISKSAGAAGCQEGRVAIDNSRTFRQDPRCRWWCEVNAEDLDWMPGIVANPNCTTAACIIAYKVLHDLSPSNALSRLPISPLRAAVRGHDGTEEAGDGRRGWFPVTPPQIFAYQIAYNLIPSSTSSGDEGYTLEEWKMVNETRKMLHDPKMQISCTASASQP